jgi:phage portal protein BeeE
MAANGLQNIFITNGLKAVPLNALPEEAWRFLTGDSTDTKDLKEVYGSVPWLYRGVRVLAQAVPSIPFVILKGEEEVDHSEDYENKVGWLPDPFGLLEEVEADLTLHGRAYLLKMANLMGRPLSPGLRRLYPNTMRPRTDPDRGITGFIRTINGRQLPPLDRDEIVFIELPDPFSELDRARSPAEAALSSASVLKGVDDFAIAFMQRGAVKVTLLSVSGAIADPERDRLKGWWAKVARGVKGAFASEVINADRVKPEVIGEGLAELSNQSLTKEKREDISTALGIPQSILFSTGSVNRAVSQVDDVSFYSKKVVPDARFIERQLNAQFFFAHGLRLQFRPQEMSIFQRDEEARSMALVNLVHSGETLENAYQILGFDIPEEVTKQRRAVPSQLPTNGTAKAARRDLESWRRVSTTLVRRGKQAKRFESEHIDPVLGAAIQGQLELAESANDVDEIFDPVIWGSYP